MLICVTHRQLCQDDFLMRIRQLAEARPYALLLREKDLDALRAGVVEGRGSTGPDPTLGSPPLEEGYHPAGCTSVWMGK